MFGPFCTARKLSCNIYVLDQPTYFNISQVFNIKDLLFPGVLFLLDFSISYVTSIISDQHTIGDTIRYTDHPLTTEYLVALSCWSGQLNLVNACIYIDKLCEFAPDKYHEAQQQLHPTLHHILLKLSDIFSSTTASSYPSHEPSQLTAVELFFGGRIIFLNYKYTNLVISKSLKILV